MDLGIPSPPSTNTKHNSTAAGSGLKPIQEEGDPEASFRAASPDPAMAAAAAPQVLLCRAALLAFQSLAKPSSTQLSLVWLNDGSV